LGGQPLPSAFCRMLMLVLLILLQVLLDSLSADDNKGKGNVSYYSLFFIFPPPRLVLTIFLSLIFVRSHNLLSHIFFSFTFFSLSSSPGFFPPTSLAEASSPSSHSYPWFLPPLLLRTQAQLSCPLFRIKCRICFPFSSFLSDFSPPSFLSSPPSHPRPPPTSASFLPSLQNPWDIPFAPPPARRGFFPPPPPRLLFFHSAVFSHGHKIFHVVFPVQGCAFFPAASPLFFRPFPPQFLGKTPAP